MGYRRQTFIDKTDTVKGTVIKAEHFEHIEDGILTLENTINNMGDGSATTTEENVLIATSNVKSYIAKNDGSTMNGGSYGSLEFNFDAYKGKGVLNVTTDEYAVPPTGSYTNCVLWALYVDSSSSIDNFVASGSDVHEGVYSDTIDLSQYPTANVLKVFCTKSIAKVDVEHVLTRTQLQVLRDYIKELENRIDELTSPITVNLPDEMTAVKGERLCLYHRGIFEVPEPSFYDTRMSGTIGVEYARYYRVDCSTVGDYTIIAEICDKDGKSLGKKTMTLHVVNPISNPSTQKNVLMLGSSTMGSGTVSHELKRRLTETSGTTGNKANPKGLGLSNISFVGRKAGSDYTDVQQEANGGWNYQQYATAGRGATRFYVTGVKEVNLLANYTDGTTSFSVAEVNVDASTGTGNIRCISTTGPKNASGTLTLASGTGDATITYTSHVRESYSPFYDSENKCIDFVKYANEYCGGTIDCICAEMSSNDTNSDVDMNTLFSNYIKPFIRKYHEQFPNGKYIIGTQPLLSTKGGIGTLGAIQRHKAHKRYWQFWRMAHELANDPEFSSYVYADNGIILCDSENIYPVSEQPVMNRSELKEYISSNGNHPSGCGGSFAMGQDEGGCLSIADALYQVFNEITW